MRLIVAFYVGGMFGLVVASLLNAAADHVSAADVRYE